MRLAALLWLAAGTLFAQPAGCDESSSESRSEVAQRAPAGPGELDAQEVVYLGLVDGSVVAWNMHNGRRLWNFTSRGTVGSDSHDVVSEYGKPSLQMREGQELVTELGGQGSNYVLDGDGGLFEHPSWNARGLVDAPAATSQVLRREGEEGEDDGVLFIEDKVVDVYGVDPFTEGLEGQANMKFCRLANRPDESCGAYDDRGKTSRTLVVTRTTYTMTEQRAGNGEVLWNRSSSFYDMKMSHPGIGGAIDQPWSIVQRAVGTSESASGEPQWQVDAFDSEGTVQFSQLLPAQLVASFTLMNGQISRNGFNDCGDLSPAECWSRLEKHAFEDTVSVFKHKNAYFALPAVEMTRAPLNPLPNLFQPPQPARATGLSAMIGDGLDAAVLVDADCDAEDADRSVSAPPGAGPGWDFDGGSTRTDIATGSSAGGGGGGGGTDSQLMLHGGSEYRGFWRREERAAVPTSTAVAVFTRQDAVVPIHVDTPQSTLLAVDEVQLIEADDRTSSGSSGSNGETVNVQDVLQQAASRRPTKTIKVEMPEFLDDFWHHFQDLDITFRTAHIVTAVLVVLGLGMLGGKMIFGEPGACRKRARRIVSGGDGAVPDEHEVFSSEESGPASGAEETQKSPTKVVAAAGEGSPEPNSNRSPSQQSLAFGTPRGEIPVLDLQNNQDGPYSSEDESPSSEDDSDESPTVESAKAANGVGSQIPGAGSEESSSEDESSVDESCSDDQSDDDSDGSPSAAEGAVLKTSKSEPNLSKSGRENKKKSRRRDKTGAEHSSSSSQASSKRESRSPQLKALRSPYGPGGPDDFSLVPAPESNRSAAVSRYTEEFDEVRKLGKGGQGTVFVAHRHLDGIDYAVKKVLLPRGAKDRDRVLREVKSLAQLEHLNIVRYYNAWIEKVELDDSSYNSMFNPPSPHGGVSNSGAYSYSTWAASEMSSSYAGHASENSDANIREVLFIQMKLYAQETLAQYLAPGKRERVDEEEAIEILLQILAGLSYVHKEGLIHRDLKPANIFRSDNSQGHTEWKIGDFGLSKSNPPQGSAGGIDTPARGVLVDQLDLMDRNDSFGELSLMQNTSEVGTYLYASPEQARPGSSDISGKTDMFSIGVILVEMFVLFATGQQRIEELKRARDRHWEMIDGGNFERDLCGLELMARECLDARPDKRPTAETFYLFAQRLLQDKQDQRNKVRERASSSSGTDVGATSSSSSLGPRQRSGIPVMDLQPERFYLHVWGTDEAGTLGTRVQSKIQLQKFGGGGKVVRVEKYEQVEGHEQVTLRYVLSNVRPDGGIFEIRDEVDLIAGVLECKAGHGATTASEPEPEQEEGEGEGEEEEPLKTSTTRREKGLEARSGSGGDSLSHPLSDVTVTSDAGSAPSAPMDMSGGSRSGDFDGVMLDEA